MKKKQATRERIFRNNKVELTYTERLEFVKEEYDRQIKKLNIKHCLGNFMLNLKKARVDITDPFTAVTVIVSTRKPKSPKFKVAGYSKRMPNDVPNDRIAIQVAVSFLIKRLKNG